MRLLANIKNQKLALPANKCIDTDEFKRANIIRECSIVLKQLLDV